MRKVHSLYLENFIAFQTVIQELRTVCDERIRRWRPARERKEIFMYTYVEDKEFLRRIRNLCGEIMQDLCHYLNNIGHNK